MDAHAQRIKKLTWDKCTVYGNMEQLREFHAITGIPISREHHTNLKAAYTAAKKEILERRSGNHGYRRIHA